MINLPDGVLFNIIEYLSEREIFSSVVKVSKSFFELVTGSPYVLGKICRSSLKTSRNLRLDYDGCKRILKQLLRHKLDLIEFEGFGTTGGYDEDRPAYWVSNLFNDDGTGYCSRDNKNNINAVGVLKQTQSTQQSDKLNFIVEVFENCEVIARYIRPPYKNDKKINNMQLTIFNQLYLNYRYDVIQIISDELKIPSESVVNSIENALKEVKENNNFIKSLRRRKEDPYVMLQDIDYQSANTGTKLAVIRKLYFSRKGNFTCPVENFLIFVSEVYVDIEDEEFARYDDLKSAEILDRVCPGECRNLVSSDGVCYREFYKSNQALKPIVWGKFTERSGVSVEINLQESVTGNYLYVKLVNPENRMAEMHDMHQHTNIDCDCVQAYGTVIDLVV